MVNLSLFKYLPMEELQARVPVIEEDPPHSRLYLGDRVDLGVCTSCLWLLGH